jgi:PST family polysaccharide transporter
VTSEKSLGQKTVSGGLATVGAKIATTVVSVIATMFLARIIDPADFGLLGKVTALTGIVVLVGDLGLSLATIQSKTINQAQLSAFFCINVLVGLCLAIFMCSCAPLIALFYSDNRVQMLTCVLALNVLLGSLAIQHTAVLQREMRFAEIAIIQIVAVALAAVIAITIASRLGYWALLIQIVATTLFKTSGVWWRSDFRPDLRFFGTGIRNQLKMGGNLTASKFVNYFSRNADNILIAKIWGEESVAYYSKAYSLLLMPLSQLAGPMSSVAVPALSRLQDKPDEYRAFFRRGVGIAMMLQIPITFFAAIAGREIILTLLGPKWLASIPIFYGLVPCLLASSTSPASVWVVMSTGQTARYLKIVIANSIVVVAGFCCSVSYGVEAMAWTFSIIACLLRIPTIFFVFKTAPVELSDFFMQTISPTTIGLVAGCISLVVFSFLPTEAPWLSLMTKAALFATVYCGLAVFTQPGKDLTQQLSLKFRWSQQK